MKRMNAGKSMLALLAIGAVSAQATLLSYEPFAMDDYTVGDLNTQNPAVAGYSSAWTAVNWGDQHVLYTDAGGGMAYAPYNASEITQGASGRVVRQLDNSLSVDAATVGTLYLSFLYQNGRETGATVYQVLSLHNGNDGDANKTFVAGMTADGDHDGNEFGFGVNGNYGVGDVQQLAEGDAAVHRFVVRFDLSDVAASDSVTVWLDPTSESGGTTVSGVDLVFNSLMLSDYDGNSVFWDDIRWATTFDEVLPTIPSLSIASISNNQAVLVWPVTESEFLLMQSTNLVDGEWDYTGNAQDAGNGTNFVVNTMDENPKFYRLMQSSGEHLVPVVSVQEDADGATLEMDPGTMKLQVFSPSVVRVAYSLTNAIPTNSLTVIASATNSGWTLSETTDDIRLTTASLEVRVNRSTGSVGFYDTNGMALLKEQAGGGKTLVPKTLPTLNGLDEESFVLKQSFELGDGEALSGLGQFHNDGVMNRVGQSRVLLQENQDAVIPVLQSSKGYALLWDSAAITTVDMASFISNRVSWSSEAGDAVDYYFCYGPDPDDAIAGYRHLTGAPPLFGKWAWGFWQCRERYRTQAELLDIVDTYRSMNIPLDGIIQDWQYWPALNDSTAEGGWGSHEFDTSRYPDPQAMVNAVHDANVHIIISVWPKFDVTSGGTSIPNLQDLETLDGALDPVIPYVYPAGQGKWLDPFSAGGRQAYWQGLSDHLFSLGIDGWWLDGSEPELSGNWGELREFDTALGAGAKVHNAYSLMQTAGVYEGQRAENSDKRVFILTRSGFAGQQRNAAVTWSGDIGGTWGVLAEQIPAGLNFTAAGVPYWNTDIGGFFGGQPTDPGYAELYTRWFQYGAFCPMFRSHASTGGNDAYAVEIWRFPAATQTRLIDFVNLRYHLIPYIYSVSWMVTSEGYTMMRPLMMDFPADSSVFGITDQYMFGPALMACPVTTASATSRNVYLPAGTSWYDFWTGNSFVGGQIVSASAPIEKMPIFVRAGSILPYGPDIQYATESVDPMEIRVYRGADGNFSLYEDENDGYDYETGSYATIPFIWDDSAQTLTIGTRQGSFPGMLSNRTFRVVWVGAGHGVGIANTATADEVVNYTGTEVVLPSP